MRGCLPLTDLVECKKEDDIHTVKEIYSTLSEITEEDHAKLAGHQVLNRDSNILSLLLFMITNRNKFMVNSELHHIDTNQHANFTILP